MTDDLKNARGIVDRPNQFWREDAPPGAADLACLEAQYDDKLSFVRGMTLPASCNTETRVLSLIGMYETFGSDAVYQYGQAHPQFLQDMDATSVANCLHSTRVPSNLSLLTCSALSTKFFQATPAETFRVMVLGSGCGVEGVAIMKQSKDKGVVEIVNVDILNWPQVRASTAALHVIAPADPFLGPGAKRVDVLIASISA